MSGLDILVDTNILAKFLGKDERLLDLILDNNIYLSFISELELLSKRDMTSEEESAVRSLIDGCVVLNYNEMMKRLVVHHRRTSKLKLPDAIIAATALHYKLPFLTLDSDFNHIKELTIISIDK